MPDRDAKFHNFSLKSILFKGRHDWYFCYLKSEKIAHVLIVLSDLAEPGSQRGSLTALAERAEALPGEIAHLAAGEVDAPVVLADVFTLLAGVRSVGVKKILSRENALVLMHEYEQVAERLVRGSHPSPFIAAHDFSVPHLEDEPGLAAARLSPAPLSLKDKKMSNDSSDTTDTSKGHPQRKALILEVVRKQKSASIRDIAKVVKDCSEKTIQRELGLLIKEGLVRKVGERRWSTYVPVS